MSKGLAKHARVFKGDIAYSKNSDEIISIKDGYIVLFGNTIKGVYSEIPEEFKEARLMDYTDKLIIPGFNNNLVKLKNYEDYSYEKIELLWKEGTTRLNTISLGDINSSYELMDFIELMGLGGFFSHIREDEKFSIYDLEEFALMSSNVRILVRPYIFADKSDENIESKADISRRYSLQFSGINLDMDLVDGDVGGLTLSILKPGNDKYNADYYAYSPYSYDKENMTEDDVKSLKMLLNEGKLGLYTEDGHSMVEAIRYELENNELFNFEELFYMATELGGKFFGKVGKFEELYSFDALIIDDDNKELSVEERVKEFVLNGSADDVYLRYIYGMKALGK